MSESTAAFSNVVDNINDFIGPYFSGGFDEFYNFFTVRDGTLIPGKPLCSREQLALVLGQYNYEDYCLTFELDPSDEFNKIKYVNALYVSAFNMCIYFNIADEFNVDISEQKEWPQAFKFFFQASTLILNRSLYDNINDDFKFANKKNLNALNLLKNLIKFISRESGISLHKSIQIFTSKTKLPAETIKGLGGDEVVPIWNFILNVFLESMEKNETLTEEKFNEYVESVLVDIENKDWGQIRILIEQNLRVIEESSNFLLFSLGGRRLMPIMCKSIVSMKLEFAVNKSQSSILFREIEKNKDPKLIEYAVENGFWTKNIFLEFMNKEQEGDFKNQLFLIAVKKGFVTTEKANEKINECNDPNFKNSLIDFLLEESLKVKKALLNKEIAISVISELTNNNIIDSRDRIFNYLLKNKLIDFNNFCQFIGGEDCCSQQIIFENNLLEKNVTNGEFLSQITQSTNKKQTSALASAAIKYQFITYDICMDLLVGDKINVSVKNRVIKFLINQMGKRSFNLNRFSENINSLAVNGFEFSQNNIESLIDKKILKPKELVEIILRTTFNSSTDLNERARKNLLNRIINSGSITPQYFLELAPNIQMPLIETNFESLIIRRFITPQYFSGLSLNIQMSLIETNSESLINRDIITSQYFSGLPPNIQMSLIETNSESLIIRDVITPQYFSRLPPNIQTSLIRTNVELLINRRIIGPEKFMEFISTPDETPDDQTIKENLVKHAVQSGFINASVFSQLSTDNKKKLLEINSSAIADIPDWFGQIKLSESEIQSVKAEERERFKDKIDNSAVKSNWEEGQKTKCAFAFLFLIIPGLIAMHYFNRQAKERIMERINRSSQEEVR
jgi:hypothetical protein